MSSIPGIDEVFELLENLKRTVQEFAGREQAIEQETRNKRASVEKANAAAAKTGESDQAGRIAEVEADHAARLEACRAQYERREAWIRRAHQSSLKRALKVIEELEGRGKYTVQKGTLDAERLRTAGEAETLKRLEQFRDELERAASEIVELEHQAAAAFRGSRRFRGLLKPGVEWQEPKLEADEDRLFAELKDLKTRVRQDLSRFKRFLWLRLARFFPVWLLAGLVILGHAAAVYGFPPMGWTVVPLRDAGISLGIALAVLALIHLFTRHRAGPSARTIAGNLSKAWRLHDTCHDKAEHRYQTNLERIRAENEKATHDLDGQWEQALQTAAASRERGPKELEEKARRIAVRNERAFRKRQELLDSELSAKIAGLRRESETGEREMSTALAAKLTQLESGQRAQWEALEREWRERVHPLVEAIRRANDFDKETFPDWEDPLWEDWVPPKEFRNAARFGRVEVDLGKLVETLPRDERLAFPGPGKFSLPLLLKYPAEGSLLFETGQTGNEDALGAINSVLFRLLASAPPGRFNFTILDPVGLGQSFAGWMHLADYEEEHINSRIWTQTDQIEERLAELNEHMEKVIQMYLRNEYETIAEYNARAGSIAERYHVLVVAGFPVNFSDTAIRRLLNIAASGARCGVFTLIHWDQRQPAPRDFVPEELRKNSARMVAGNQGFNVADHRLPGTRLVLDAPPPPAFATAFLHKVGQSARDSSRVEVPFAEVMPEESALWSETTTDELRVPIGRSGATKLQYLAIGRGTRQHALIAGKTGSGKSTLFHVIITNLALWCGPDEVEFYLVDFKKGVEFKCYASHRLPHARVVAIESDRAFGLSVLQRVDEELRRRGELFRKLGVQDFAGYRREGGQEPLPRTLLIIDEFQEFFTEEDRVSQSAAVLLDRIVRQGRAFGIHVLLGSQTLGGAYTLARATIGQMVIRIALQCNEADAYLIMDENNSAPRLLSRPGEGIYNDMAGALEGNSPFQTVWLPDDLRERHLLTIRQRAEREAVSRGEPVVFEGNSPADVRENPLLNQLLKHPATEPAPAGRIWLGAPNTIKGPTEAMFQRRGGGNLLVVGQGGETCLTLLSVALVSLAAQYPPRSARFILMENQPPGSAERAFMNRVVRALPHEVQRPKPSEIGSVLSELSEEMKRRTESGDAGNAPTTFVIIDGLQNFKKLRQADEFSFSTSDEDGAPNPGALLLEILSEGPAHGIHALVTLDTWNNVTRFLGRKGLSEFEMRVVFQMSAADSASLIDAPDGSELGLHRALYFNEREGYVEKFRPYALPDNGWMGEVEGCLRSHNGAS
ncbi:MAG TPA: FtsK/SpoIIIE domain-containing protein [Methylomirabilota bacterium]|nr:FtsK/SpoIIIE domain-containing protein [Methylomirabilota bacterium]